MTQGTLEFAAAHHERKTTRQLVTAIKEEGQDFEWYPTTDAIISKLISDLRVRDTPRDSVLDIGAGNGKVLRALSEAKFGYEGRDGGFGKLYAIEKSQPLLQQLEADIFIVGTEFAEQSLISKRVDVIFCNPPYSEFEQWAEKIIRQAAASVVYLVLPERWATVTSLRDALRFRDAEAKIVGSFDFENAERKARARVNLLRVKLETERATREGNEPTDAFKRFFEEQFAGLRAKFGATKEDDEDGATKEAYERKRKRKFSELVVGPTYPDALVSIYNAELAHIENNYRLVAELDADLLREFDISPERIMQCLNARLSGLRNDYWHELFAHLSAVTDRLTSKSRKQLLETLYANVHVDFTIGNIYAVVIWVLKNANKYIDQQLVETYELMVDKCNVVLYKSNKRTWSDQQWRYSRDDEDKPCRYSLDYRIVTHRAGGCSSSSYSWEKGLEERGAEFLGDLLTIARNLGFNALTGDQRLWRNGRGEWKPGVQEEFMFLKDGEREVLFDVRAFKNRNMHLRLNKSFILALNVEHGRLKGWLRTPTEAAEELQDPKAAGLFNTNARLNVGEPLLCISDSAEKRER